MANFDSANELRTPISGRGEFVTGSPFPTQLSLAISRGLGRILVKGRAATGVRTESENFIPLTEDHKSGVAESDGYERKKLDVVASVE
ncbi:hypothetical protein SCHPADRAFT_20325 [Schizopora paradoxa]|uniref:Uncharacterized protein n=1 Tax=Schizopora paradoxa TaxID=27342 RepID=A0A0H2S8Y4_9AGAM|nr:hypothetical protein SCHPADRAFT_20325 [Schizopora paradoxa]